MELMAEEEEGLEEELMEQLQEVYAQPININEVRTEDLEVLPFLSKEQVEGIVKYVEKNKPVESLGELMFVRELGMKEREMLRLFVEVRALRLNRDAQMLTAGRLLKYGKQEAVWRTDVPLYWKAGYADVPAKVLEKSPNKVYRGDPLHHAFRYAFSSMGHLYAGLSMEKDAGERGVDYVSGYVMLKEVGCVKSAIVGNYKVSFGKGLVVNNGMKLGKMTMLSAMDRMDEGIKKQSSTAETGYFTGGAATFRLKNWQLSAFGSYRKEDGTYNSDSTGMTSLKTDGLHRTRLERSKKGNLGISNFGGNVHWEHKELRLSATVVVTHLDVPLMNERRIGHVSLLTIEEWKANEHMHTDTSPFLLAGRRHSAARRSRMVWQVSISFVGAPIVPIVLWSLADITVPSSSASTEKPLEKTRKCRMKRVSFWDGLRRPSRT